MVIFAIMTTRQELKELLDDCATTATTEQQLADVKHVTDNARYEAMVNAHLPTPEEMVGLCGNYTARARATHELTIWMTDFRVGSSNDHPNTHCNCQRVSLMGSQVFTLANKYVIQPFIVACAKRNDRAHNSSGIAASEANATAIAQSRTKLIQAAG